MVKKFFENLNCFSDPLCIAPWFHNATYIYRCNICAQVVVQKPDCLDCVVAKNLLTADLITYLAFDTFRRYKALGADGIFRALLPQGGNLLLSHQKGVLNIKMLMRDSLALAYIPNGGGLRE